LGAGIHYISGDIRLQQLQCHKLGTALSEVLDHYCEHWHTAKHATYSTLHREDM
jgi:hypothetical protein